MSYSIAYSPDFNKKYPSIKPKRRKLPMKLLIMMMACIASYILIQCNFFRFVLPGDPDVTISALSTLVKDVGNGNSVKDAIMTFCEEIILNSGK